MVVMFIKLKPVWKRYDKSDSGVTIAKEKWLLDTSDVAIKL
jgi:hypothetical protein